MVVSSTHPATVSRTSSSSSIDFTANAFHAAEHRRTRKRITAAQLKQLEQLYSLSSHPTRDERDALAKRIQMETKSVTIWFQNKRQTDRKVALHNTTNSRNVGLAKSASATPNITLTTPTSAAHPPGASIPEGAGRKSSSDDVIRRQPPTRPTTLKRDSSFASSVTSVSMTASSRSRPSLDRVASRSEIRLTDRPSVTRSSSLTFAEFTNTMTPKSSNSNPFARSTTLVRTRTATSSLPASPPPSASPPLWATMLSSPLAPSSPPTAEYVAYTNTRKSRTLDWACAAARLAGEDESSRFAFTSSGDELGLSNSSFAHSRSSPTTLGSAFATASEREYQEATALTEDEAELVTPHGSQDAHMPWVDDGKAVSAHFPQATIPTMDATHLMDEMDTISVAASGWEEDEMHAALALCVLRG